MSTSAPRSKPNLQVYDEAAEWLVHFRVGDAEGRLNDRRQFDEWLRRSPGHMQAYLEVSAIWEDVAHHDAERKVDAEAHIARALSEANVVALDAADAPAFNADKRRAPRRGARVWAAAAAIAGLGLVSLVAWLQYRPVGYATAIGEQRSVALEDGSTMELNARSRARVRFTEQQRLVELLEGQALFQVAKNPHRPFIVSTGTTRVQAIGTQFDVNRRRATTTVTVIEGRVSVAAEAAGPSPAASPTDVGAHAPGQHGFKKVLLAGGEQAVVTARDVTVDVAANVNAATAWTRRHLIFDSALLSDVAEEFNRYNARPIIVEDETLRSFKVIGVFSSTDSASMLAFLRDQPEIEVIESSSAIVVRRK